MKARTWHNVLDRSTWARSPLWDDEPDKMQWADEITGFACLAVRHPISGHWSGYVGVRPGHPLHGVEYGDDGERFFELTRDLDVHCGITCGTACQRWPEDKGGVAVGVCHEPDPGEPDDQWWLGFDCMHPMNDSWPTSDLHDYLLRLGLPPEKIPPFPSLGGCYEGEYRTLAFVQGECAKLATQLKSMGDVDGDGRRDDDRGVSAGGV